MVEDKKKPQKFQVVSDPLQLRRLLMSAIDRQVRVEIQPRNPPVDLAKETKIVGKISEDSQLGDRIRVTDVQGASQELFSPEAGDFMLLLYLPGQAILGVEVPLKGWDEKSGLEFACPERAYLFQRRKDARYMIPPAYEILVSLPNPERKGSVIQRRILDLSAGGLSFAPFSSREAGFYRKDLVIGRIEFTLLAKQIIATAEVRNRILSTAPGGSMKIGLFFKQISDEDREFIADYVNAHVFRGAI